MTWPSLYLHKKNTIGTVKVIKINHINSLLILIKEIYLLNVVLGLTYLKDPLVL